MAEHVYAKGTRVWFEDKEQAWLSAEVTQVVRSEDAIKLVFLDERGKVRNLNHMKGGRLRLHECRKLSYKLPLNKSKMGILPCHLYETLHCLKVQTI